VSVGFGVVRHRLVNLKNMFSDILGVQSGKASSLCKVKQNISYSFFCKEKVLSVEKVSFCEIP
jgi:hypothetical protein